MISSAYEYSKRLLIKLNFMFFIKVLCCLSFKGVLCLCNYFGLTSVLLGTLSEALYPQSYGNQLWRRGKYNLSLVFLLEKLPFCSPPQPLQPLNAVLIISTKNHNFKATYSFLKNHNYLNHVNKWGYQDIY